MPPEILNLIQDMHKEILVLRKEVSEIRSVYPTLTPKPRGKSKKKVLDEWVENRRKEIREGRR